MLAHHYLSALELDRAAGVATEELTTRARLRLGEAGDRADALSAFRAAKRFYGAAVELWPEDDEARADLFFRYARVVNALEPMKSIGLMTRLETRCSSPVIAQAAEAEVLVGEIFWLQGQRDQGFDRLRAAEALIADQPSSYSKAYVVANMSRFSTLAGDDETGSDRFAKRSRWPKSSASINSVACPQQDRHRPSRKRRQGRARGPGAGRCDRSRREPIESVAPRQLRVDPGRLRRARASVAMHAEALRLGERFGSATGCSGSSPNMLGAYFEGRWHESSDRWTTSSRSSRRPDSGWRPGFTISGPHSPGPRGLAWCTGGRRTRHRASGGGEGPQAHGRPRIRREAVRATEPERPPDPPRSS